MTKIKLLAIDLDGTLLSKTKHISHRNLKALRDYTNSGGTIVLASGRSIVSIKRIVNKIDRFTGIKSKYSIAFNGGYIDDISNDSVIENKIPNEVVKKIWDYAVSNKMVIWVYNKEALDKKAVYTTDTFFNVFVRMGKGINLLKLNENVKDISSYKINLMSTKKKRIHEAKKWILTNLKKDVSISTHPRLLEINLKNINKGFALDLIAKKLNINRNEMAMIGDSNNDLTAMKNVGLPIGVKTKSEYVKKAVKYYLPYKRNAVANAICKYILSLNKQIELIATDLDGTLLHNGDKIILPNVVKSIQKVVDEKKLKFVICTGRSIDDILVVVKNLKIKNLNNVFIIGANGAFIYDVYNQRYIDEKFVKILYAKQVIDLIKSFYDNKKFKGQVGFEIFNSYTVNEIKSNKPLKHFLLNREFVYSNFVKKHPGMMINNWAKRANCTIDDANLSKIYKFVISFENQNDKARVYAALEQFKDVLEISSSGPWNIEVMPQYTNKGSGLKKLCAYLGVDERNTMTIGDELNDVSMLELSKHSVTLLTSCIKVKESAGHVMDYQTSDIVGKAIDQFILNKDNAK